MAVAAPPQGGGSSVYQPNGSDSKKGTAKGAAAIRAMQQCINLRQVGCRLCTDRPNCLDKLTSSTLRFERS